MALRTIRLEGDPILRKKSREVTEITPRILSLLDDMVETMEESQGIGIAAPQVGVLRRLIIVDVGEGLHKMINPKVIEQSEETVLDIEGCLSVPDFNATVYRPKSIVVEYQDETGERKEIAAANLFARCILHEIDHLDGILYRDRIDRTVDLDDPDEETLNYLEEHKLISRKPVPEEDEQ